MKKINYVEQGKIYRIIKSCVTIEQLEGVSSWIGNIPFEFKGDSFRRELQLQADYDADQLRIKEGLPPKRNWI